MSHVERVEKMSEKQDWQWCKKDNVPMKEIGGNIWNDHDFITYECPICHKRVSTMFAKMR